MESKENKGTKKNPARMIAGYAVRWLLPLALTVLLVTYMFRKVDFSDIWNIISHGVDYGWILCAMGLSVLSHVFRALRWRIQLKSLGIHAPIKALCCSIFGCYALNLVFPRLGEVWRCTYIARREHAAFPAVLGSMVADRFSDALCGATLIILTFVIATPAINSFLSQYPMGQGLLATGSNPWFWITLVGSIALIWSIFYFGRDSKPVRSIRQWISDSWKGFQTLAKMKGKWGFILLSIGIWACYYFQLYVAFFAFDFTRDLCREAGLSFGLTPCLVTFVLSSIGMAVPSNGGLGPWNLAVMFGLAIYGISNADGTAFSMLQWSGQTVMLIFLGIITMIYIAVDKKGNYSSLAKEAGSLAANEDKVP